ncbi:MAG: DUF2478 domain-containing protein [Opitutae bacterium]|nr:DUF2478 domain-containing protein [Opitutae bacterium]
MPAPAALPAPSLLIAVTGGLGSSKTRLLAELAAAQIAAGQRVEGVLSIAGHRAAPRAGASDYWLRILGSDSEHPWATRDEKLDPPYLFEPGAVKKVQAWAERLRSLPPPPLLVLDEFGKFEARGLGLMPVWPLLMESAPRIVVISVRDDLRETVERLIGRKFDLRIPAEAPDARARLELACRDYGEWTRIGLFGGGAGGLEMTVGAALHATKIPLRGLVLSSLQAAMMVFAGTGLSQPGRVVWVPFISGGLKALSPAGDRVRPMIAIIVQGLLFGGAVQALGWNLFSIGLGGALVGAWAALQGFVLQYLLMGTDLVRAYDALVLWLAHRWHLAAPGLPSLLGAWAALHALAAGGAALTAWCLRRPPAGLQGLIERESGDGISRPGPVAEHPGWAQRLREFGRWQFWLPLLIVAAILLGSGRPWEGVAWLVLRFFAVGCVLVALVSLLRPARWAEALRRRGWWGPALAFSGALRRRAP